MANQTTSQTDVRGSLLRFDLAVQRTHLYAYSIGLVASFIAKSLGVLRFDLGTGLILWGGACAATVAFYVLYRSGIDRRILNPIWMANNVLFVTLGIGATGGIESPWFIWYVASALAAAFATGRIAGYAVSLANAVAYVSLLMLIGDAPFGSTAFYTAVVRMLFVFGASYFFLTGVATLNERRIRIKQLEGEERRRVQELTRLTEELAAANRGIVEADRLKTQFLANMSHELRTPMNSIIGFSEILVERLDDRIEAKHVSFLKHILASGQHLLGIINDILDLSKIEAGKMEIFPETFLVTPAVESVCQVVRGMSRATPSFVLEIPEDLPPIETDHAKFRQVLLNLLSNATKFSTPGSPITISAHVEDTNLVMTVSDQGIGIAPEHHEMIFEEFRQVDGTKRREFGGTGLGLALVKKFVELQGGSVAVESAPGSGSAFSFSLPLRARAAVVSRGSDVDWVADRVLVIEDDGHAYDLISSALSSAGYLAIRARHGEEALRLARATRPIAITLDLVLPGADGWDVLKRLKNDPLTSAIPVVIISMIDNRDLGVALGADDYFIKPVDRTRLLERIQAITAGTKATTRPRLLLIDDDASIHALLDEELARLGYTIDSAYSGEDGLRVARDRTPDVIILDLLMPGMSGFEVADSLKGNPGTADIPILVLTSKEVSAGERSQLRSKVISFVQKGRSAREQLVREIRRVTASAC